MHCHPNPLRWILLFFFCISASSSGPNKKVSVFFTSDRQGELEPCGCKMNPVGGIHRMAEAIKKESKESTQIFLVDSGDSFFKFSALSQDQAVLEKEKAKLLAESYQKMKLTALAPGPRDFAAGLDFLRGLEKTTQAKFISSNLKDKNQKLLFEEAIFLEVQGKKIGLVGVSGTEGWQHQPELIVSPEVESVRATLEKLSAKGMEEAWVVSQAGLRIDRELASLPKVKWIFGGRSLDPMTTPEKAGDAWIVQTEYQGKALGKIELDGSLQLLASRFLPLSSDWEAENAVFRLVKKHRETVRKLAVEEKGKSPKLKQEKPTGWIGNPDTCKGCHTAQYNFWEKTNHASAYLVLYAKNQHFDPECIECHSLGFKSPGGFQKIADPIVLSNAQPRKPGEKPFVETLMEKVFAQDGDRRALDSRTEKARYTKLKDKYHELVHESTPKIAKNFLGVQCEHCHGSRVNHQGKKISTAPKIEPKLCIQCHQPPRDDAFDFAKKLPLVACPKMKP